MCMRAEGQDVFIFYWYLGRAWLERLKQFRVFLVSRMLCVHKFSFRTYQHLSTKIRSKLFARIIIFLCDESIPKLTICVSISVSKANSVKD